MADFEVRGGQKLRQITAELNRMGDGHQVRTRFSRELRATARPMVADVRASIMAIPTHGSKHTGLRARMAAATSLHVNVSARGAAVWVIVDGRKMPPGQGSLPAYMEGSKPRWQHPVYGVGVVTQASHPYFAPVVRRYGPKTRRAVYDVVDGISDDIT
ncbi:MAG: hypothetical protein ACRDMV_17950 [Streptosporangiales bacterium]